MHQDSRTVFAVDTPASGGDDRTTTSFSLSSDRKRIIIESSRELRCDELARKLHSIWDMLSDRTQSSRERTA